MNRHLAVIDMQDVFADPASEWATPRFAEIVPRVSALVDAVVVPGFAVAAIDTTGAGDTHVGVFVAALARGEDPVTAARTANAAAALSVTRRGPATAPTAREVATLLDRAARR